MAPPDASRGNLTSVQRWVSGADWLTQTSAYFDSGEIAATTAPNGGVTNFAYDGADGCAGAFPTSVSLPLNLSRTMTWDCAGGVLSSRTDENGHTTTYTHDDPFWRLTGVSAPDGGGATTAYLSATETETTTAITGSESRVQYTLLDSMGQPSFTQVKDGSACDTVQTTRNAMGWVVFTSRPYSSPCENPASGGVGDSTDYDALGRPTAIYVSGGAVGGTSNYTYAGNDTAETSGSGSGGAAGTEWQYNALGELASVCAATTTLPGNGACGQTNGGTGYLTAYTRNALGEITEVEQDAQTNGSPQYRNFGFDGLGRLISETTPESGSTTFTYGSAAACGTASYLGRLVEKMDNMGNVTCFAHDALGRTTAITYPSGPYDTASGATPMKTFIYGAATVDGQAMPNALGRLAEAYTGPAGAKITDEGFGYDSMGRVTTNPQCAPAASGCAWYAVSYTYDLAGETTTEATGDTITYGRDALGRISSVTSSYVDGYHYADILTSPSYNAAGELTSALLADGTIAETRCYDAQGRITGVAVQAGGAPPACGATGLLYGENLTYDSGGTVATIDDTVNGDWSFQHDDLGRLSGSTCTAHCPDGADSQAFQYKYDPFGNRTQQNVTGGSGPSPQYSFQNNRITTLSYDGDGNLTNDGFHAYTYDADGRLLTVDGAKLYAYNAFGQRVEHVAEEAYAQPEADVTYDLDGHIAAEHTVCCGAFFHQEIYAGSLHVATYSDYMYFDFDSTLGTGRYWQSVSGPAPESCASLPFGDGLSCQGGQHDGWSDDSSMHFTGAEHDFESNLEHFRFRQYSATQGLTCPRRTGPQPGRIWGDAAPPTEGRRRRARRRAR